MERCIYCKKPFRNRTNLTKHVKAVHNMTSIKKNAKNIARWLFKNA